MAEMEHYPNFQKDNYIHPKAAWDKLRMAGARRQNVYLYAATGYGKTELLHRYLRRRRHIWLSGEGLTVETLQEIALPARYACAAADSGGAAPSCHSPWPRKGKHSAAARLPSAVYPMQLWGGCNCLSENLGNVPFPPFAIPPWESPPTASSRTAAGPPAPHSRDGAESDAQVFCG